MSEIDRLYRELTEARLGEIPENCQLVTDDTEITHVWQSVGHYDPDGIPTGLAVDARDGDYVEVWATWSRAPYSLGATYYRIR